MGRNIGVIGAGTVLGMREGRVRSPIPEVARTMRKCVYERGRERGTPYEGLPYKEAPSKRRTFLRLQK